MTTPDEHRIFCREAADRYLAERDAVNDARIWHAARLEARLALENLLEASDDLRNMPRALTASGAHTVPLRHLLAPPISQDQFKLICGVWSKSAENSGRPLKVEVAAAVSAIFDERRDTMLMPWIDASRAPTDAERATLVTAIEPLIANQQLMTGSRNNLAKLQEDAVIGALIDHGWTKLPSRNVVVSGAILPQQFMHKVRFASGEKENKEIDIACGLRGTKILAVECKVTNDITNSIKRIDDVLTKTNYWKDHWGTFLVPAAVLQGNIKMPDVQRLLNAGVTVFWSHRLDIFLNWLDRNAG